jgi:hypothetical protein
LFAINNIQQDIQEDKGPVLIQEKLGLSNSLNLLHDLTPNFEVYPEIPKKQNQKYLNPVGMLCQGVMIGYILTATGGTTCALTPWMKSHKLLREP